MILHGLVVVLAWTTLHSSCHGQMFMAYPIGQFKTSVCKDAPEQLTCSQRTDSKKFGCTEKTVYRCPSNQPYWENAKCLTAAECPNPSLDALSSLPTGHNFILAGSIDDNDVATGMHISGVRLPPHWYHGLLRFQINDPVCAQKVRLAGAAATGTFLSIRYAEAPIKLVDLVQRTDDFDAQLALGTGPYFKLIDTCSVRIKQVIDFRRYDPNQSFRQALTYVAFNVDGNTFLSHLPQKCKDFQQLVKVELIPKRSIDDSHLEQGIVVGIVGMKGTPKIDGAGAVMYPFSPNKTLQGKYSIENGNGGVATINFSFKIVKDIIFDQFIVNLFCP